MDLKKRLILSSTQALNVYRMEIPDEANVFEVRRALAEFSEWVEELILKHSSEAENNEDSVKPQRIDPMKEVEGSEGTSTKKVDKR